MIRGERHGQAAAENEEHPVMAGRRILLVEDSSTMRRMIGALLEEEGFEVTAAVDGKDALEKVRQSQPELILTDFEMPVLDGAGLFRTLKEDPNLRGIPVLMLTSLGDTENRVSGLDAGADDYIQKPQSPGERAELYARIRAHLRTADLQREIADRSRLLEAANNKFKFELDLARKVQLAL